MGIVDLPILPLETSLNDAGDWMSSNGVSAVATVRDEKHFIITADDMHDAVRQAGDRVGELTLAGIGHKREATPQLTIGAGGIDMAPIVPRRVDTFSLAINEDLRKRFMAHQPGMFHVVERTAQFARVVTFDASFESAMNRSVTRGTCRDPQKHKWYAFQLIKAGLCNIDDTVVDF
jgi:hypothetical protein